MSGEVYRCRDYEETGEKYMKAWRDNRRVIPARRLFPCPLEVLRALGYPEDRRVSEFKVHVHALNII